MVEGISGLGVCFYGGGGQALNRLNDNRGIFEVSSPIR